MATQRTRKHHETALLQLTNLPTAAGHEDCVIRWILRWMSKQKGLTLKVDKYGNLHIKQQKLRSARPVYLVAHMDHPAFVVQAVEPNHVLASFHGGVGTKYFKQSHVLYHQGNQPAAKAKIIGQCKSKDDMGNNLYKIALPKNVVTKPGDVLSWYTGKQRIIGQTLHTPAADNLAGVAAALCAYEMILKNQSAIQNTPAQDKQSKLIDVRLLFTRGEEVGFIGALGVCHDQLLPKQARIIVLENSKCSTDAPLGKGPIVRVGDAISSFDPSLLLQIAHLATQLQKQAPRPPRKPRPPQSPRFSQPPRFIWQRKLMTGGACEATAFCTFGYQTACLCLPLGHYHNQNEKTSRIAAEYINLQDYHGLVRLLVEIAQKLDVPTAQPPLKTRLNKLFLSRRKMLMGCP